MLRLINTIKEEKWIKGVRTGDALLIYSLRCKGEKKYIKKLYGSNFFQMRMLIPREGSHIRVIGIKQEEKFRNRIKRAVLRNSTILMNKVKEDEELLLELISISEEIKNQKIKNQKNLFKIIKKLLEKHYFLFFLCFSLGAVLFENKHLVKDKKLARKVLKIHDNWRNTLFEKEMGILDKLEEFLKNLAIEIKIKDFEDLYYLEIKEFEKVLRDGFITNELKKRIYRRKKGFAYISFPNKIKIIEDHKILKELEDYFKEDLSTNVLKGTVGFRGKNKIIKGKARIVKDPRTKIKIEQNTILIVLQTTPDFVPIIKNFSGIIADEGGITSHAAIISREFKIPCIIGTQVATKVLKDGDLVEMDTEKGIVKILKRVK